MASSSHAYALILALSLSTACRGFRMKSDKGNDDLHAAGNVHSNFSTPVGPLDVRGEGSSVVDEGSSVGDSCLVCIANGGGKGCASRCNAKSSMCKSCVANGGGKACASRCGGQSPSPPPRPRPSPRPRPRPSPSPSPSPGRSVNWNSMSSKVSKYFNVREVTNGEKRRIPKTASIKNNVVRLAKELDKVREAWGGGLLVNSWYRPPDVNRAVGGARHSQHLHGSAVDIRPANGQLQKFQDWLDKGIWKNKALGYGAHRGFVHIDMRSGHIRWNYR